MTISEGGTSTVLLSFEREYCMVFINPNFNSNRCYEILKPPYHGGLGWGVGGEKRSGVREARAGEAQVNK
jgi:hypothetical protein